MSAARPILLCLASYFKGGRLLEGAHAAGAHVILLTREKLAHEPWPFDAVDERFLMPSLHTQPDLRYAVSYLARTRAIARIVALDEYDTLPAAALREHLRVPGMGETTARFFRDKLAMRTRAREHGLKVPPFVHVLNDEALRAFSEAVPPPWVLKPRTEASAMGIKQLDSPDALWQAVEALGNRRSFFLLERYVPGAVYHVDGLVTGGTVRFAAVSRYERPPMDVYQTGGVFVTRTVPEGALRRTLHDLHARLVTAFGFVDGVTHAEFIRGSDGAFHFLEVAARVGGAGIDRLVEAARGVNLWTEWGRLEVARAQGASYTLPPVKKGHAGLVVCLARQEHPDLSAYDAPEVFGALSKPHHAGLIVAAPDPDRVAALVADYGQRFAHDFLTTRPPLDEAPE